MNYCRNLICTVFMLFSFAAAAQEAVGTRSQAIASLEGKFEFALDAPWRIEPSANGYGLIPIQVSVHDVDLMWMDRIFYSSVIGHEQPLPYDLGTLGQFQGIEVEEMFNGQTQITAFDLTQIQEVEYTQGFWPAPPNTAVPVHRLCRVWSGETCGADFRNLQDKSEWHATLFYRPLQQTPGTRVNLVLRLKASRAGGSNYFRHTRSDSFTLENRVNVHLAESPLPRFDPRWIYGDLHYHSQGTDNEGESAYSYRGVLYAMRALGLDFLFATEHASNSSQIVDVDIPITFSPSSTVRGLRDMSAVRFAHNLDWLNQANRELPAAGGWTKPAQMFLGGEVDVIPEITKDEQIGSSVLFGNGQKYEYWKACGDIPYAVGLRFQGGCTEYAFQNGVNVVSREKTARNLEVPVDNRTRFLLKDVQGKNEYQYFARQHLLHLPLNGQRRDAFVPSSTSKYGGATRRLVDLVRDDYGLNPKGVFFLAHPLSAPTGSGYGRLGPDIVPYSAAQLKDTFDSPQFLGLQIWNEDTHLSTEVGKGDSKQSSYYLDGAQSNTFSLQPWYKRDTASWQKNTLSNLASKLHHGCFTWDRMLRWGLNPKMTADLTWLLPGMPRRVFIAAGSDAHGDLNYRREGALTGTDTITDTAIGKPRVLAFAGPPNGLRPQGASEPAFSQAQVVNALKNGSYAVTDGPAIRIAIDANANDVIDDNDVLMGDVHRLPASHTVVLLVEWKSTPEFGPVTQIDLYLGAHSTETGAGMTYAPAYHGVRGPGDPQWTLDTPRSVAPANGQFRLSRDGYWADPYENRPDHSLRIIVPPSRGFGGTAKKIIIPDWYWTFGIEGPAARADRFYVRAFARTRPTQVPCPTTLPSCQPRYAFTNPVWILVGQ